MLDELLARVFSSQWLVILFGAILFLVAAEIGFRLGIRLHRASDEARRSQIGGIQGAILGMLGLLLGFTFAMAVARYESRRELVLREANAIGTTFLRTSLLSDKYASTIQGLLNQYIAARLAFYEAGEDRTKQKAAEQSTQQIQRELWAQAVVAAKDAPAPLAASFISSLNETIDLDASRRFALRSHVPGVVWILVLSVAACGCVASGYAAGASGVRGGFTNFTLPLLIAIVVTLIADLDRPRGGLIGISQQPLVDLKESM